MEQNKQTTDFGSIIGIVIVIIVLLLGAFYFTKQRIEKQKEFQATINQGQIANTSTSSDKGYNLETSATSMNFDDLGNETDSL